jgi:hypothetical protein
MTVKEKPATCPAPLACPGSLTRKYLENMGLMPKYTHVLCRYILSTSLSQTHGRYWSISSSEKFLAYLNTVMRTSLLPLLLDSKNMVICDTNSQI